MTLYEFLSICSDGENTRIRVMQDIPYEDNQEVFSGYVSDATDWLYDSGIDSCTISEWKVENNEIVVII